MKVFLSLLLLASVALAQQERRVSFPPTPQVPIYEWLTNYTTTSLRNDFDRWVGVRFTAKTNFTVIALGRWVVAGNTGPHPVKLRDISNGQDLASEIIVTLGATAGAVKYAALSIPITLVPGDEYALLSLEGNNGDQWYDAEGDHDALVNHYFAIANDDAYSVDGTTMLSANTGTNSIFGPVNFKLQWPHEIPAASTLTDGLAAYWKLDEASGTRVDSVGGQDLTDNNTVTSAAGQIGDAGQFTRANSEYLSRADSATVSTGDIDYTIAAWVRFDTVPTVGQSFGIVSRYDADREFFLFCSFISGAARFSFEFEDANIVGATTFGVPSADTFYLVIAHHDATANEIGISVNAGAINTAATTVPGHNGTDSLLIGAQTSGANFFNGRIDEVGFWKRKLTEAEIDELFAGWTP